MSSRKGKVARDREEKVAGRQRVQQWREEGEKTERREFYMLWKGGKNIESNREEKRGEKQRKTKEERVLHALKRGKKTKSPIEKRKGEKK